MDEIFGEGNLLGLISVVNNLKGRSDDEFFATANEYLLVYGRNINGARIKGLRPPDTYFDEFQLQDKISRYKEVGLKKTGKNSRRVDRPNMFYPIYYSATLNRFDLVAFGDAIDILPLDSAGNEGRWRWGRDTFLAIKDSELTARKVGSSWNVYVKMRDTVDGETRTVRPKTLWIHQKFDTGAGTRAAQSLFSESIDFENPKPLGLLEDSISVAGAGSDEIILDFFAGSGTTGHAVMQQNAEDGGDRKYIMVQLPEPMEKKLLDDGTELNTIADITRERIRRAGKKIASEHPDKEFDTGFRAYTLAPSNFQPWDGEPSDNSLMQSARQASFMPQTQQLTLEQRILQAADHLSPQADDLAILTELLLKLGEELTVPIEKLTLADRTVYDIDSNTRIICLDREVSLDVIREMAAREPGEIICLDAGFPDDQTKVNAGQIIETQARHAEAAIAFKVV